MRLLGLILTLVGVVATVAAMFLSFIEFEGESANWWEAFDGLDIALLAACVVTAGLALAALTSGNRAILQLTGIAAAMTFGLAFAVIPDTIHDSDGAGTGRWVVGGTGAIALAGGVIVALSKPDSTLSGRVSLHPSESGR
jgi:hypothetical protein